MKKCVAWLLSLCLLLTGAAPALAAPLRDAQAMELTVDLGMTSLLEMVLGAAVNRDVDSLPAGEAPSQALMEGVLTLGLYQLALPYSGNELFQGAATLSQTEIAEMYGDIFTSGAYAEITAPTCPCITAEKGALRFDLSSLKENPVVGVSVYSTRFDGTDADVLCDLYLYYGEMGQSAEALPEDALTWLCQARVSLRSAPETLYGYTVNGFSLSPTYQDGMLADWQENVNEEYGYSFNLPSIMGLAQEDAAHRVWQTADGAASLSNLGSDVAGIAAKKNLSKAIRLRTEEDKLMVDVSLLVTFGSSIPTVAKNVQNAVLSNLESVIGLKIGGVNVYVSGIAFAK